MNLNCFSVGDGDSGRGSRGRHCIRTQHVRYDHEGTVGGRDGSGKGYGRIIHANYLCFFVVDISTFNAPRLINWLMVKQKIARWTYSCSAGGNTSIGIIAT